MITVLGIFFVAMILALTVITITTQEARLAEHKIRRMRAFYAAHAGIVYALEELDRGVDCQTQLEGTSFTVHEVGYPTAGYTVTINCPALIDGWRETMTDGPDGTLPVSATVSYTSF
jgi:Tfp pilus assembly protein PilX